jgi:hypothetical protein
MEEINRSRHKHEYDLPTAVTFLVAGLGLGSLLTLLFSPRFESALRETARPSHVTPVRQPTL